MLVGELVISLYPTNVTLELFVKKNKKVALVSKHVENFGVSFTSLNKIDAMDIERIAQEFLKGTTIKSGTVRFIVYADKDTADYYDISLDTTSKKEIKQMLPIEIESKGEHLAGVPYRHKIYGSNARVHFMLRNIVESLSSFSLGSNWQVTAIVSSVVAYEGLLQNDGLLLEINTDEYKIYAVKSGFIQNLEIFPTYSEFSLNRATNPSESELFAAIKNDVADYVQRYKFNEDVQFDMVYLNFVGDVEHDFSSEDFEGTYYTKPEDLRNWLSVSDDLEKYRSNTSSNNSVDLHYEVGTLGMYYGEKTAMRTYNFAPERLSTTYRKLLASTLSFSLMLAVSLPIFGMFTENYVEDVSGMSTSYKEDVAALKGTLGELNQSIEEEDKVIDDYNSYVNSLGELADVNRNFISNVLTFLPSNTSTGIVINDIKLDKSSKKLELKGISQNYKDIGALAIELEEFGKVEIDTIENNKLINEQGYPFKLTLTTTN